MRSARVVAAAVLLTAPFAMIGDRNPAHVSPRPDGTRPVAVGGDTAGKSVIASQEMRALPRPRDGKAAQTLSGGLSHAG